MSNVIIELTQQQYSLLQIALCDATVRQALDGTQSSLRLAQEYAKLNVEIRTQHLQGEKFLTKALNIINPNNN